VTTSLSPEQNELLELIDNAESKLKNLRQELGAIEAQVAAFSSERQQYELLDTICLSLNKLSEMGAAALFWGEQVAPEEPEENLARARNSVVEFQKRYSSVEESQQALQKRVNEQLIQIELLNEDLTELREREERAQFDFTIEREARELPYRPMVMPWTKQGEDEKRFRKSLALVLLFVFFLGTLVNFWELPEVDKNAVVEIPEHLVQMVQKQKPKPPEKRPEEKPKDKSDEKKADENKPKPTKTETQVARKKAESSGVLAFKNDFNDLLADDVDAKLGSSARLSNKGATSSNDSSRNLVMSQAQNTSGGINTASLNRNVGGGAGKQMGSGVSFSRVGSAIGTDYADDRPLSDGPGPSRTDEEIQIVFDRYKAALYRIYNRELRKDPSLRGKMVLRITIEPDGSVSMAKVESSDMKAPELSANIVERVQKFNFGPKEGVPKTTILYPIDFLPAS
jgi:TonB family protein